MDEKRSPAPDSEGAKGRTAGLERQVVEMLVHDLQNPLAGIMAFLEIIKERPAGLTSTEHEGLEAAHARCRELSELVLSLLQLGQAERGALRRDGAEAAGHETVDLEEIARSTAEAFAPVAQRGKQRLRFKVSPGARAVTCTDERIVRRILYNLTRNALRHTPSGTTVELAVETEPSLQVIVEDDGPGIPQEIQHRVFEPGALRRAGLPSDSGLGLAFCRKAAEALGMGLRFENGHAGGCRFILEATNGSVDARTSTTREERPKQTLREVCA